MEKISNSIEENAWFKKFWQISRSIWCSLFIVLSSSLANADTNSANSKGSVFQLLTESTLSDENLLIPSNEDIIEWNITYDSCYLVDFEHIKWLSRVYLSADKLATDYFFTLSDDDVDAIKTHVSDWWLKVDDCN